MRTLFFFCVTIKNSNGSVSYRDGTLIVKKIHVNTFNEIVASVAELFDCNREQFVFTALNPLGEIPDE